MKFSLRWLNEERTRAEVHVTPSWWGRLWGDKPRRGVAVWHEIYPHWFWEAGGKTVDTLFGYADYVGHGPMVAFLDKEQSAPSIAPLPRASAVVAPTSDVSK